MKEEVVTTTVYIAEDGKRFTEKNDCEKYEKEVLALKKNVKYFRVYHNPDLTEKGTLDSIMLVAVYCTNLCHADIVENWCVKNRNLPILGESVQGYGFQRHFDVSESTEEEFMSFEKDKSIDKVWRTPYMTEQHFLSPVKVEGYPEPFNYMEAWRFK